MIERCKHALGIGCFSVIAFCGLAIGMEVVEPVKGAELQGTNRAKANLQAPKPHAGNSSQLAQSKTPVMPSQPYTSVGVLPANPARRVSASALSHEEELQALNMRLATQKALRSLQAQRLAASRKLGKKAWRKNLESFLTQQRQIQARADIHSKTLARDPVRSNQNEPSKSPKLKPETRPESLETSPIEQAPPQPRQPGLEEHKPQRRSNAVLAQVYSERALHGLADNGLPEEPPGS